MMLDSNAKIVLDTRSPGRDSSARPIGSAAIRDAHCLPVSALATAWGLGGGTGLVPEKDSRMGGTTTGIATPAGREDGRRRMGSGQNARRARGACERRGVSGTAASVESERREARARRTRSPFKSAARKTRSNRTFGPRSDPPKNPSSVWATSLGRVRPGGQPRVRTESADEAAPHHHRFALHGHVKPRHGD